MAAGASAFESRLTAAHNLAGRAAGLSIARYMAEQTTSPDCVGVAVHVDICRRTMHQRPRNRADHRVEARLDVILVERERHVARHVEHDLLALFPDVNPDAAQLVLQHDVLVVDTGRNLDLSDRRDAGLDNRGTAHRQIEDRGDDDCRPDHWHRQCTRPNARKSHPGHPDRSIRGLAGTHRGVGRAGCSMPDKIFQTPVRHDPHNTPRPVLARPFAASASATRMPAVPAPPVLDRAAAVRALAQAGGLRRSRGGAVSANVLVKPSNPLSGQRHGIARGCEHRPRHPVERGTDSSQHRAHARQT